MLAMGEEALVAVLASAPFSPIFAHFILPSYYWSRLGFGLLGLKRFICIVSGNIRDGGLFWAGGVFLVRVSEPQILVGLRTLRINLGVT